MYDFHYEILIGKVFKGQTLTLHETVYSITVKPWTLSWDKIVKIQRNLLKLDQYIVKVYCKSDDIYIRCDRVSWRNIKTTSFYRALYPNFFMRRVYSVTVKPWTRKNKTRVWDKLKFCRFNVTSWNSVSIF